MNKINNNSGGNLPENIKPQQIDIYYLICARKVLFNLDKIHISLYLFEISLFYIGNSLLGIILFRMREDWKVSALL
jgi:hypothetical protein